MRVDDHLGVRFLRVWNDVDRVFGPAVGHGQAQVASTTRIPIRKDVSTASGVYVPPNTTMPRDTVDITVTPLTLPTDTMPIEWYVATGTTCSTVDVSAATAVSIKTNLYDPTMMISPDSAKIIALCAVPGQIGSASIMAAAAMVLFLFMETPRCFGCD